VITEPDRAQRSRLPVAGDRLFIRISVMMREVDAAVADAVVTSGRSAHVFGEQVARQYP